MPINSVTILGNLTRDPELRGLPSGGSVCSLRVAVNERRKDNQTGQWTEVPNFFNVTVFGNSADNCAKFLAKGRQVAVDGRLRWREWEKNGQKREAIEIVAQDVQFIGGRDDAQGPPSGLPPATSSGWGDFGTPATQAPPAQQQAPQAGSQWQQPVTVPADDDIPF